MNYLNNLFGKCVKPGKKPPSILPTDPSKCEKDFLELLSINEDADYESNERRKGKLVDVLKELEGIAVMTPKESV